MEDTDSDAVAVIGAGSSGLAVLKALRDQNIEVRCFERGSDLGGLWRYENDNGRSGAYASLRTNVSRARMQYPSHAMPESYGDFPHHSQMSAYLADYADVNGLRPSIRFGTTVEHVEQAAGSRWRVTLDDGSARTYCAVVVATGLFWEARLPTYPGSFSGTVSHSRDYRVADPFAGRRVLIVGMGQSAAEIAVELSRVADRTILSLRGGVHVIPRRLGRRPYDAGDVAPLNRLPWVMLNWVYARRVAEAIRPGVPSSWRLPAHRLLEGVPIVSSDLLPAVRRGEIIVKPAVGRLCGRSVQFVDGSEEHVDAIVFATGYRINLPFLASSLVSVQGRELPLYRRIVATGSTGLFFAGFVDAPGGLLPVVEAQGRWIAAVLGGQLRLPRREQMRHALGHADRRTRRRFPHESPRSTRCDPHGYRQLLESDLRRARRRCGDPRTGRGRDARTAWPMTYGANAHMVGEPGKR